MINRLNIPLVIATLLTASVAFAADTSSTSATPVSADASAPASPAAPPAQPITYTSVKGDTFSRVGEKFGCTVHALKKFNGIKSTHLKVGTVLQIPPAKAVTKSSRKLKTKGDKTTTIAKAGEDPQADLEAALKATKKYHHRLPVAQPAQDFDLPPSVFASCPTPPSNGTRGTFAAEDDTPVTPETPSGPLPHDEFPAPLVVNNHRASLLPVPDIAPSAVPAPQPIAPAPTTFVRNRTAPVLAPPGPQKKSFATAIADFFGGSHNRSSESGEWGNRFLTETRTLAGHGIGYDESWRPEGESHRWEMDCSNTTKYLYQVTAGISLPRTASDQYYYLHLQDKAWDVPINSSGFADCNFLRSNLKPGDLLFWENTYRPERQPPITHVMIFLGTDSRGRWLMAGSQGSHGFYNPSRSGPDVYVFDPTHYVGGYTTWLGLVHHKGRFVAYGRPLEADVKKLSVATAE